MSNLHVYLTDGFADDHVIVNVDGRTVFDKDGVTTKKVYGLATQIGPVQVGGDKSQVEVQLPRKGLSSTMQVDLSKGNHVPISIEDGKITHAVLKQIGFA